MGLAILLGATVAWFSIAIPAVVVLVLLWRRKLKHHMEDLALLPVLAGTAITTALSISVGKYIRQTGITVSSTPNDPYAGLAALYHALGFVLLFPLTFSLLLVLASVLVAKLDSTRRIALTVTILNHSAAGAIAAHFLNAFAIRAVL